MRKSIIVNIPEPCHEDWDKMTPKDKGRHCASCNKTVVDFTKQTDEQIVKTFEANGNLCGRFKGQQLNREIVLSRKDKNNYRNWAASGLFAFLALGTQKSFAQGEPVKTIQTDTLKAPQIKGKVAHSILNEKLISGTITAASDGLPLPGVTVLVKGTTKGTSTDIDGRYSIKAKSGEILVFSYIGFITKEIIINKNTKLNVTIEMDDDILGGIVVVGGAFSSTTFDQLNGMYLTNKEREEQSEERQKRKNQWKAKNLKNRLKWKAERIAKKLARQEVRRNKKTN